MKKTQTLILFITMILLSGCSNLELDNKAPELELLGEPQETVFFNTDYTDPGYTCTDDNDDVCEVIVTGHINTSVVGDYTLTYTATDSQGLESTSMRTVTVVYLNHSQRLINEGKSISFNLEYTDSVENYIVFDYSDDERTLWNYTSYESRDIITFPDPAFHNFVRISLGFEVGTDITYGDLQTITELIVPDGIIDISSIEGIELFKNLEKLYLNWNINLTSINGVQTLHHLKELNLFKTSVKDISKGSDSIERLILRDTSIKYNNTSEFLDAISSYGKLKYIELTGNDVVIDDLVYIETLFRDIEDAEVIIDALDIDWTIIHQSNIYSRTGKYLLNSITLRNRNLFENQNANFSQEYRAGITRHYNNIGITEDMNELKKIMLVYDYVYETFKDRISENGTTLLNEIFNEDKWISKGAIDEVLVLMLKEAGVQSETDEVSYQLGNWANMELLYDARVSIVNVTLETGETYLIDINYALEKNELGLSQEYDRFLVGNETIENDLRTTYFEEKGVAKDDQFFTSMTNVVVNPGDLSRSTIIENLPEGMFVNQELD